MCAPSSVLQSVALFSDLPSVYVLLGYFNTLLLWAYTGTKDRIRSRENNTGLIQMTGLSLCEDQISSTWPTWVSVERYPWVTTKSTHELKHVVKAGSSSQVESFPCFIHMIRWAHLFSCGRKAFSPSPHHQ